MPFGAWLRERRTTLDLTQWQLAERVGCSRDMIQKLETGTRRPSKQVAELLAACLGVAPEQRDAFVTWARVGGEGFSPSLTPLPSSRMPVSPSEPSAPSHLPVQPTSLVGREHAIAQVRDLLRRDDVRLLTLVGPPGIGKTRLSIAAASTLASGSGAFKDGVFFVALESKNDPALVVSAIAQELGVKPVGPEPILAAVSRCLRHQSALLILDNFEQVLDAAPEVAQLLSACPSLKLLVTSREALHVYGEWRFSVPPLTLPDCNHLPDLQSMGQVASVALFTQRAQAVRPGLVLTPDNAPVVAAICTRLDGLPLAIELAASRVGLLSLADILTGLDHRLQLLKGNLLNLPSRQRTLRGAIDWSYHLLQPAERTLFNHLGIFVGGWTITGAEAVCHADDSIVSSAEPQASGYSVEGLAEDSPVAERLSSLVDKSLVHFRPGEGRYGMLEMLREYALERLRASGEEPELRRRHAQYYAGLAEAGVAQLTGPDQGEWLRRLEADNANLGKALTWSAEGGPETAELALRLTGALAMFWIRRGYVSEGRRWMAAALEQAAIAGKQAGTGETIPPEIHRKALHGAGILAFYQSDLPAARSFLEQALRLAEETGNKKGAAMALGNLGLVADHQGAYAEAQAILTQALALFQELDDKLNISLVLVNKGLTASCTGDFALAQSLCEDSLALCRKLGDQNGISVALGNLGQVAILQGDGVKARGHLNESLAMLKNAGNERGVAFCLKELGNLACAEHDYASAQALYQQALALHDKIGIAEGVAYCLEGLAETEMNLGRVERGVQLWGAADAIRQTLCAPIPVGWRSGYDRAIARARAECGETAFGAAWAQGRAMTLEDAIACAQATSGEEGTRQTGR